MTEPTTQELIEWACEKAEDSLFRHDRDIAHAIAERLLNHSLNVVLERSVFQADAARLYAFVNWAGQ